MSEAHAPAGDRAAQWVYEGVWRVLTEWLRVPRRGELLPVGPGEVQESFRPAPGFLGYLKLWFIIAALLFDLLLLVGWIAITIADWRIGLLLAPVALIVGILPDLVIYVALHLRYDTTWYALTARSLRMRRGIWVIHEMTITFENVQNVRVQQGPVQRLFGIASVLVETAGSGGDQRGKGMGISNRGIIEGIADPHRIRDAILDRVRASRSAGLGDDDEPAARGGWSGAHIAELRGMLQDLRGAS